MSNYNARITFEGLFLHCFSSRPRFSCHPPEDAPDQRSRCEVGILNQTGTNVHRFEILVEKEPICGGGLVPVEAKAAGMPANPAKFSQEQLRDFSSLHLYTGTTSQPPPKSGRVIRDRSFDRVLNLEGPDFYGGSVKAMPGRYTVMTATDGVFFGIDLTATAEFARVSKQVLDRVLTCLQRPENWDHLLDWEKRLLPSFAREVKAEIEIDPSQYLVIKGVRKSKTIETLLALPHPSVLEAKRYVIRISNLDVIHRPGTENFVIFDCAGAIYHAQALEPKSRGEKPEFGLSYNFDFNGAEGDRLDDELERTYEACCDNAEGGPNTHP